jgi:catechol 2,3-dioxygenase
MSDNPSATSWPVGPVTLTVPSLDRSIRFYEDAIGLRVSRRGEGRAELGAGGEALLRLEERTGALSSRRTTGLYHFALLLPTRRDLARQLRHFAETGMRLQGASDHLVSEAIYLADPDGNGIEVYRDRPRAEWRYDGGQVRMSTDPLDVEDLLSESESHGEPWLGMPAGTIMGHVHLRVSDLRAAEDFYRDVLGLELTTRYGASAAFLSYHGYHHHLGINTWGSAGAPAPPAGSAGLRRFVLRVPDVRRWDEIRASQPRAERPDASAESLRLRDPSGNEIELLPPGGDPTDC